MLDSRYTQLLHMVAGAACGERVVFSCADQVTNDVCMAIAAKIARDAGHFVFVRERESELLIGEQGKIVFKLRTKARQHDVDLALFDGLGEPQKRQSNGA